jgi:hypothetical protein
MNVRKWLIWLLGKRYGKWLMEIENIIGNRTYTGQTGHPIFNWGTKGAKGANEDCPI